VGDVMCTVAVHAIIDCGEQPNLGAAKNAVRAEKGDKSPAKPRKKTKARR